MHIVAINQVYRPSELATAQLLTELCEGLAARGHRVTVVTAKIRPGDPADAMEHGVRVVRVGSTRFGKSSLVRRGVDYASFYLAAGRALAGLAARGDVDVYLPLTTPPLIAGWAQLFAAARRTPVVSVVQDLYPDVAVSLGAVADGGAIHRAWALATRLSLGRTTRVVALSQAMAERIIQGYGVPAENVDVIANWALGELESDAAGPAPSGREARFEYGLGERFVVMYSGNMGAGHSFETLIGAAQRLRDRADIAFAFVGDGVRRGEIERLTAGLPNVRMMPLAPRAKLADSLAAGDLHAVTMRDGMDGLIVPSKLYGILAAARPVLSVGQLHSDIAAVVRRAGAGHVVANGDIDGAVQAILAVRDAPDRGRALGLAGRAHLLAELGREAAIERYLQTLAHATRPERARPAGRPRGAALAKGA
ncbi:MAG: glycosyltransferase family 4 protein [Myxococcota bacterium]